MCGFGPLPIVIVIMTGRIAEFNFWSSRCSQYFNWWLSFSLFNFHIDKSQNLFSAFLACAHGPLLSFFGKFHNRVPCILEPCTLGETFTAAPFLLRGCMALERQ